MSDVLLRLLCPRIGCTSRLNRLLRGAGYRWVCYPLAVSGYYWARRHGRTS